MADFRDVYPNAPKGLLGDVNDTTIRGGLLRNYDIPGEVTDPRPELRNPDAPYWGPYLGDPTRYLGRNPREPQEYAPDPATAAFIRYMLEEQARNEAAAHKGLQGSGVLPGSDFSGLMPNTPAVPALAPRGGGQGIASLRGPLSSNVIDVQGPSAPAPGAAQVAAWLRPAPTADERAPGWWRFGR
jgi:hypothetical protein